MRQTSSRRPADLSEAIAVGEFLIADPRICHGKLTFKGTRLPVHSVLTIQELRPNEQILDDRIPQILRALRHPTFVTIDQGFWNRRLCHPAYCILHFPLRDDQQSRLPGLLRALWRLPEFRVRKRRM